MRSGKLLIEKVNENKDSFLVNKLIELGGAIIEVRIQSGVKIIDFIKSMIANFYKMEDVINQDTLVEDSIYTKDKAATKAIIEKEGLNIDSDDSSVDNLFQKALLNYDMD